MHLHDDSSELFSFECLEFLRWNNFVHSLPQFAKFLLQKCFEEFLFSSSVFKNVFNSAHVKNKAEHSRLLFLGRIQVLAKIRQTLNG
jgi:hypothetical protein